MADKKIIAVVGATGAQGGGVVRAILNDKGGPFTVRAITRDVNSDGAKALKAMGAEVVAGDVDDVASLTNAFQGRYGAFCVTFFWAHLSPERENAQAGNLAQAAKAAGLQHVDLVHARGHAEVRPAQRQPDADADGEVQGPALRREGGDGPRLRRARRADDLSARVVLLGEFHLLRRRPEEGARWRARAHDADRQGEDGGRRLG